MNHDDPDANNKPLEKLTPTHWCILGFTVVAISILFGQIWPNPTSYSSSSSGYSKSDTDWMKSKGVSPVDVRAAQQGCGSACR